MKAFFDSSDIDLPLLDYLCSRTTSLAVYPFAEAVERNVVIYDGGRLREALMDKEHEKELTDELNKCLRIGPGVLVVRNMYEDESLIDSVTSVFTNIIVDEKGNGYGKGDHFGDNERVWNSFQKVALQAPGEFVNYYGNPLIALVARAWLGPFYQMTAQVNNVKPGSMSQSPHRDYHLGFQTREDVARFPAATQMMSQFLTLQGAIAHGDMPLESGPTLLLPFSQQYAAGYMAYALPEFKAYFEKHCVQLPLQKGDGLFFSPALFHGAGTNNSAQDRMANLLQISSAFGRPMESVDTHAIINAVYPHILNHKKSYSPRFLDDIVAAIADGYSFPTNLDTDPPRNGTAPAPEATIIFEALQEEWPASKVQAALNSYAKRRMA